LILRGLQIQQETWFEDFFKSKTFSSRKFCPKKY
jgi:hypothetical protein